MSSQRESSHADKESASHDDHSQAVAKLATPTAQTKAIHAANGQATATRIMAARHATPGTAIQRKAAAAGDGSSAPRVAARVGGATGAGEALPTPVRAQFEQSFGADLGDVRIHRDDSAEQLRAEAYTRGNDIHFAPGKYNPESSSGKELLGHELTHVVQQRGGQVQVQARGGDINADVGLEAEAEDLGTRAARGERVAVRGVGGGTQLKTDAEEVAEAAITAAHAADRGPIANESGKKLAEAAVSVALEGKIRAAAKARADQELAKLVAAATDAGVSREKSESESFKRGLKNIAADQRADVDATVSSKDAGLHVERLAYSAGKTAGREAAQGEAQTIAEGVSESVTDEALRVAVANTQNTISGAVQSKVDSLPGELIAKLGRDAALAVGSNPPANPAALPGRVKTRIGAAVHALGVDSVVGDDALAKLANKAASKQEKSTKQAVEGQISAGVSAKKEYVREEALNAATTAAEDKTYEIQHWTDDDANKLAIEIITAELTESLKGHVAGKLNASRFHQWGRKRELREQLKSAARTVVNQEIDAQIGAKKQAAEGQDDLLSYHGTKAKREAYGEIKQDVGEFLTQVGVGIASRAAQDQKLSMAARAVEAAPVGTPPMTVLRASQGTLLSLAKAQADLWVEQMYTAVESGTDIVAAAQNASTTDADVRQAVSDRKVAELAIEAASTEEGMGILGRLLDTVIPDAGDGVAVKITLKVPAFTTGFASVNLIAELNGKAGRGTEGFVTEGVPKIASNPKHLELQLGYAVGFSLEAGSATTLGVDLAATYNSFVRAGADSTESALAAFRYAVYRGTPVKFKSLAGAWYGAMKQGRGPQGVDYLLAEQRAAAVEEQHFLAEGKERTFAQHGRAIGIGVSAAANVDGAELGKLGASGAISASGGRFRHFGADSDVFDGQGGKSGNTLLQRPESPKTQEEARDRRAAMSKGKGSTGVNAFGAAVETEINLGGIGVGISGAISGNDHKNWGIEVKAALTGKLVDGLPMDWIVTLATSIYELEHRLLSAAGDHMDQKAEMLAAGMSQSDIKDKLKSRLLKRTGASVAQGGGLAIASALGIGESGIAASLQFGLTGGSWTTRFDLISSMKIATPDSLPVFGAEMSKETRLISAEHQGLSRAAFRSPGVLAENTETD